MIWLKFVSAVALSIRISLKVSSKSNLFYLFSYFTDDGAVQWSLLCPQLKTKLLQSAVTNNNVLVPPYAPPQMFMFKAFEFNQKLRSSTKSQRDFMQKRKKRFLFCRKNWLKLVFVWLKLLFGWNYYYFLIEILFVYWNSFCLFE